MVFKALLLIVRSKNNSILPSVNRIIMDAIINFFKELFSTNDFMPRWVCGNWTELHGWLYIASNLAIWAAYFTIPLLLLYFINKQKGFKFNRIFVWFILFIFFCGTTHFLDAVIFWIPVYRFNAIMLLVTAVVSWVTVGVMYKYLPKAFDFKSPEQLQLIIEEQTKELKTAYLKLAESEKQFKVLVNSNPDIITRIGKDLKYNFINESIYKVRNIAPDDILGKTIAEVDAKSTSSNSDEFLDNVVSTFNSGNTNHFEFTTHTIDNQNAHFSASIIPLINELTGEVDNVLTVSRDITTQKNNKDTLQQNIVNLKMLADKLEYKRHILEDFTFIVSHNLRSPVANLATLLQFIQEETDLETREIWIQKVIEAFEKLSDTVNDLTAVVQIRQNTEISKEILNFEVTLKNHLTIIETQIAAAEAEVLYDFSKCESIEYSKIYLDSIILNLLTNAIKYHAPNRKPVITFKSQIDKDGLICLTCQDNGLGIDLKKYGHKIFGLHKTFHNHPDSKGVGLFITKNQVETLGGSIVVESEVDKGSKFTICFNSYDIN